MGERMLPFVQGMALPLVSVPVIPLPLGDATSMRSDSMVITTLSVASGQDRVLRSDAKIVKSEAELPQISAAFLFFSPKGASVQGAPSS